MNIYGTNNGDILTGTFDNDIIYAYAGVTMSMAIRATTT